jgi:hypothetical protein
MTTRTQKMDFEAKDGPMQLFRLHRAELEPLAPRSDAVPRPIASTAVFWRMHESARSPQGIRNEEIMKYPRALASWAFVLAFGTAIASSAPAIVIPTVSSPMSSFPTPRRDRHSMRMPPCSGQGLAAHPTCMPRPSVISR